MLFAFVAILVIAYVVYKYEKNKQQKLSQVGGSSAFSKVADLETKFKEAEGKLISLKAVAEVKQGTVDALKTLALEAHVALDELHKVADEVHELIG